jgi:methyl-accepting chemotaxis protein
MAFGLFRKRLPEPAAPAVEPAVGKPVAAVEAVVAETDSAREILGLREIDVPVRVNGRHWGAFRTAYKL